MKKLIFLISFILLGIGFNATVSAQTKADIKSDEISDAKIRDLMKQAEATGYSDAQLEQMAIAQGMSPIEAAKLKARVEKIREADKQGLDYENVKLKEDNSGKVLRVKTSDTDKYKTTDSLNGRQAPTNAGLMKMAFEDLKPKIFGSELFKNSNMAFEPNLRMATPKNYVIGPDDELLIDFSGDNERSYRKVVSPEGSILLQYGNPIIVGGLTIEQATAKIKRNMALAYPGLRNGRTEIIVNLGLVRNIKVILTGQVTKPGTYTVLSLASVFNALYAGGGPNENGSYRNIQIIRNGALIKTLDVYDFLTTGIQKENIRLNDQDVINIPFYKKRVELVGEVKNPAIYEVKDGETFQKVLDFAGGFSSNAYRAKVKVLQNTDRERKIADITTTEFAGYEPNNGDKFFIERILERFQNRVEITGAVFRPAFYELESGLTVKGLIQKADGLKEDAFMNRGYISRLNPDNSLSLLDFDLRKLIAGTDPDIALQREDKVVISSIFDLREEYKISINGEVRRPGEFNFAENMSLESLIQMAGGLNEGATPNRVEVSRRLKNSDANSISSPIAEVFTVNIDQNLKVIGPKFTLQPFDIVSVRGSSGYEVQRQVFIEGEVLSPGPYTIKFKNERISDLIKRAGGLTATAYADGASLKRTGKITKAKGKTGESANEEEQDRITALERTQETKDSSGALIDSLISSDIVGINLEKILEDPKSRYDLFLEEGDVIRVPVQLQTVKVTGEILNPNNIVYSPNKGFMQYINGAGGYSANALKRGVFIKYANGSAEAVRQFLFFKNYPKVKPGAEILVPKRAKREPLNAQGWIGLGTAIASLGAIIVSILR